MDEAKLFIAIGVILLLGLLQTAVNVKDKRRIRQLPMTVLSVILMILGVIWWNGNLDIAEELCAEADFLENGEIFVINASLLLVWCLLRMILVLIFGRTMKDKDVLEILSLNIYWYDEAYDEWFLRKQFSKYRTYFLALCIMLSCFTGSFLGLTWALGQQSSLWLLFYPSVATAVMLEAYNYLNGQTKEEFLLRILGEDSDSRRVSNYYKLREILEEILPEPLLTAHTGCEFSNRETAEDLLKRKKDSPDRLDQITAAYFYADERFKTADADCVAASFCLMHRRNVVFFNPFYRDLGPYITMPMVSALLSGKRCVVLCGRRSCTEDVKDWLSELLKDYSHMRSLWRVAMLTDREPECEIGILTFAQLYDKRAINANRDFLRETDFVLMVEPSGMLNTSQVALSILAEEMHRDDEYPVYCICDRYTDGLVDTLSHLLHAEITDVVAMPVPRCDYSGICWNVDGDFSRQRLFDKQTRYLGNGVELAAIAVKNQIPQVTWYSESKAPLKDISWIAGQYYATICRYMNQPSQQKTLYEKIRFVSTLWGAKQDKEGFYLVEDEFCNMFSTMRAFLSRGKDQAFVNILSENYLLRDYMRCNRQMFLSDPNAIPSLVPDYAKTERNTLLKLLMTMSIRPVREEEVLRELHLVGIEAEDATATLSELLSRYTFADSSIFTIRSVRIPVDEFTSVSSCVYTIAEDVFERNFADSLKSAYFILENEKEEEGYIDAKLFGHVTQTVLPGQFVTYDGKYYIVKYVAPQSGVVLRRASDLYTGRKYYRQIRRYRFDSSSPEIIWKRTVGDVEFTEIRMDYHVDTTGYLEMSDAHDLRMAKEVDFSQDPTAENYFRKYRNKSVLQIRLPESDDQIRFTICLLLMEMLRSLLPEGWPYVAILSKRPEDVEGMLDTMVYRLDGLEDDDDCIYFIEDSTLDLGLTSALERNFNELMEILTDFLEWHMEKMREPASKDPQPVKVAILEAKEKKKRNLVVRMLDRIRKLFDFGKKGKEPEQTEVPGPVEETPFPVPSTETEKPAPAGEPDSPEPTDGELEGTEIRKPTPNADDPVPPVVAPVEGQNETEKGETEDGSTHRTDSLPTGGEDIPDNRTANTSYSEDELGEVPDGTPEITDVDGIDIFKGDDLPSDNDDFYLENEFIRLGVIPLTESRYQKECFMKFGFEKMDSRIDVDKVHRYLRARGWSDNSLTRARKREILIKTALDGKAENHCDFCGIPLNGVSYDRLNDGRVRCNNCSASAISRLEDFRELFYRTLNLMENFYGIRFRVPIRIKTADARTVNKGVGVVFRPSTGVAPRVLGYAQYKRGKYSLIVENGSPRLATIDTMVHEMTHIWQYINWKDSQVRGTYGMNCDSCTAIARDIVYEGMAMWASIQYLYQIGESYYAAQQEAQAEAREDVYGIGFRLYREQYPLMKDSSLLHYSPFLTFPTIDPERVREEVKKRCLRGEECKC